jgi:hypothetical protein
MNRNFTTIQFEKFEGNRIFLKTGDGVIFAVDIPPRVDFNPFSLVNIECQYEPLESDKWQINVDVTLKESRYAATFLTEHDARHFCKIYDQIKQAIDEALRSEIMASLSTE